MQKGKIVLGAAAILVTAGSSLAFNIAKKFTGNHVFVKSSSSCFQCASLVTGVGSATRCRTANLVKTLAGAGTNLKTFYKTSTCASATTNVKKAAE